MCNLELKIQTFDPTGTTVLRKRFESEFYKRFRRIKGLVNESVITNDVFDLRPKKIISLEAIPPGQFQFLSDAERIPAFLDWLMQEVYDGVYELYINDINRSRAEVLNGNWWADSYIREAYGAGVGYSVSFLSALLDDTVISFLENSPVHIDKIQMLYTRVFEELEGITAEMSRQIARELADGLIAGENPNKIARRINKRIDAIGITRARMLARTEIIRSHSEGTLNMFELAGIEEVELQAEFLTAGDERVCPICDSMAGKIYELKDAHGVIPVHPNCRCTWLPYDPEIKELLGDRY